MRQARLSRQVRIPRHGRKHGRRPAEDVSAILRFAKQQRQHHAGGKQLFSLLHLLVPVRSHLRPRRQDVLRRSLQTRLHSRRQLPDARHGGPRNPHHILWTHRRFKDGRRLHGGSLRRNRRHRRNRVRGLRQLHGSQQQRPRLHHEQGLRRQHPPFVEGPRRCGFRGLLRKRLRDTTLPDALRPGTCGGNRRFRAIVGNRLRNGRVFRLCRDHDHERKPDRPQHVEQHACAARRDRRMAETPLLRQDERHSRSSQLRG